MAIQPSDFDDFHRGVHGAERGAFDWQKRLLHQVFEKRCWPKTLDLPTGVGKTTCIDIALFSLALDAQRPLEQRWCPRRIAMVVDRRVVVDQVAERGRKLAAALADPNGTRVVVETAHALRSLCAGLGETADPIGVFTLRGGVPKDDGWARSPDQPLVLASTVDQLGSRLLVQGYGVSRSMRPVHAGLLGNDILILLDEVHLSQPFAETLLALNALRERPANAPHIPKRFHFAFLSATPGDTGERFALTATERRKDAPLGPRLHAPKRVSLEEVAGREKLEDACVKHAASLIKKHRTIAIVVNRIRSAATIAEQLSKNTSGIEVRLITGRMRPLDRDGVMQELRPRVESGRKRTDQSAPPLIVVGTQSIEAGADFDFDALISEGASLDALRQRFGRLDRLGEYGRAEGAIVFDKSTKRDDPVYGASTADTLTWLKTQLDKQTKTIDFGVEQLKVPEGAELMKTLAPRESAPILLPAYMDLWMQTAPEPSEVPDPTLWLHGPRSGPPDVQVIWRVDLTESLLADPDLKASTVDVVAAIRPSALEAISLPFATVRAWLSGQSAGDISDVEGVAPSEQPAARPGGRILRWRGERSEVSDSRGLRPGDTIVVPAARGGIHPDHHCFDPDALVPVKDLAEQAAFHGRGQPMLRLHPDVLAKLDLAISISDDLSEVREQLEQAMDRFPDWRKKWLYFLARGRRRPAVVEVSGTEPWLVLQGQKLDAAALRAAASPNNTQEAGVELTTDEEDSFYAGRSVSLSEHSSDVEKYARGYATAVGLSDTLTNDLALAGWLHDIGKADQRFQILLRGGSEIEWRKDCTLWAKSAMSPGDKAAQRRARARSGYPTGTRHEVQSLSMIEHHLEHLRSKADDIELVRFLVASHHGNCRPFAPPATDASPTSVQLDGHRSEQFGTLSFGPVTSDNQLYRLDSQLADRFWRLVEKYGWLELCWLEAILRLADHRASEAEQAEEDAP